jgi:phosphodiesterase/alkaline phosphatase D-like protein
MSETDAFNQMSYLKPDLFINVGDMHYSAYNQVTEEELAFAYHEVFKSKNQRDFYQKYPLVYTFDDHDVGSNNANHYSKSVPVVNKVYRVSSVIIS